MESQIKKSIDCLIARDEELATAVRADDKQVDQLELRIDELALEVLALRQPMASDLRHVVCALKVAGNLERIGDYAKNISKRAIALMDLTALKSIEDILRRMAAMVQKMVHDVLNAYVSKDIDMADEVILRDEEVDFMHNTIFAELLGMMKDRSEQIDLHIHLLFIAKNIERMGDHTTAVAEQIHYVVTGQLPEENRPKSDITSEMTL